MLSRKGRIWTAAGKPIRRSIAIAAGVFLKNPLTSDGERYVQDAFAQADGNPAVTRQWRDFYEYLFN
jgi:hypothetical protein